MSALAAWLVAGVVHGTLFLVAAWLLSVTLLRAAHPASRAVLFLLVLLKFVLPFGPSLTLPVETSTASIVGQIQIVAAPSSASSTPWLLVVWLAGVVTLATVRVVRHLRTWRAVRAAPPVSPLLRARVEELAHRLGTHAPDTRLDARGPGLVGVTRPVLLLPPEVEGAERDAMIAHELAHLRRHDALVRLVQVIVETLFFFWPAVHLASRQLELAREQACDLTVVEADLIAPPTYADLLLRLGLSSNVALGMSARPTHLERRITMVLRLPASLPLRWAPIAAVALAGVIASGATLAVAAPPRPSPLTIDGQLDARVVQTVISTHLHEITTCYRDYLAAHPGTQGRVVLHWAVKDDGTVEETCQSAGTTVPAELGRCVSDRVTTWGFPSPGYGQRASVEYTFELAPEK